MIGILVRAILFGIGVEVGRDIYTKLKKETRPQEPSSTEPPSPDLPHEGSPPPDVPDEPGTVH